MDEEQLDRLIADCEAMLAVETENAHKHPVPLEFEGSRTFSKAELNAVWSQGRKDALRFVLINLRAARGY